MCPFLPLNGHDRHFRPSSGKLARRTGGSDRFRRFIGRSGGLLVELAR